MRRRLLFYAFVPARRKCIKDYRALPISNSRRLRKTIALVLFDIKEKYSDESVDTGKLRNEDNEKLKKALFMAFNPYTNKKVIKILQKNKIMHTRSKYIKGVL